MSDVSKEPPRAHIRITYTGPVYPHWEIVGDYGDPELIDEFARRAYMRLLYVPMRDSQFRRNRERIKTDAKNENIGVEWFPPEVEN
jgi:hypothetical protein